MANDETVTELSDMYSKMSLLELLAEENMITELLHRRTIDAAQKRFQKILRLEIEKKLQ
ncbi:MAG: hypothetical protein ACE5J2_06480 [Nitrososphaerales archaeon]